MRALTVWQPWATLIIAGLKPYEFRRWPAPRGLVGKRIVVHAGSRPIKAREIVDLIERVETEELHAGFEKPGQVLDLFERVFKDPKILPLAAALGTTELGTPRKATDIFAGKIRDSSRIDEHVWGWPMIDPKPFEPPVPCRGFQGFWTYQGQTP